MPRSPYSTILCPTDFSHTGNQALPVAFALAVPGSSVHLLHVVEAPPSGEPPTLWGPAASVAQVAHLVSRARANLEALLATWHVADGVRTELHVEQAWDPARAIEEVAERIGADIVVMGTHGRTGLGRVLMGSVATEVVRHRRVPFLLLHDVRARERQAQEAAGCAVP